MRAKILAGDSLGWPTVVGYAGFLVGTVGTVRMKRNQLRVGTQKPSVVTIKERQRAPELLRTDTNAHIVASEKVTWRKDAVVKHSVPTATLDSYSLLPLGPP